MKQSHCLSLILCQNYTVKKQSFFPIVSQKLQPNQPFANSLDKINRMCEEEIECPRVGELPEWLQNGDGEPTISYMCNAHKHDIWQGWPFAFLFHLDGCHYGEKSLEIPPLVPKNRSVDDWAHLEKSRTEISRNGRKLVVFPQCTMPNSLCLAPFWGTWKCPRCAQVGLLEILSCLLSNLARIFEFGAHFPLQIFILPILLSVCQKSGRDAIFGCFLTFRRPISCQNF